MAPSADLSGTSRQTAAQPRAKPHMFAAAQACGRVRGHMGPQLLPCFGVRADIQLMGPAITPLAMQVPIGFGNTVRLHKGIGR